MFSQQMAQELLAVAGVLKCIPLLAGADVLKCV